MTIGGHILIVDNNINNVSALDTLLTEWKYKVFTACSASEARLILDNQHIDLAIIDVRLDDENEPTDRSGIKLAAELDDATAKILITAHDKFELREKWLRSTDIHKKEGDFQDLRRKIATLFAKYVRYNHSLKIQWSKKLTPNKLMAPLKKAPSRDEIHCDAAFMDKFEHMLRKLFFRESRIELKPLDAGQSGAGVVLVKPYYEKTQGAPVVVKYGHKADIMVEHDRYGSFVEPFLVMHTTHLIGKPEHSHYLAGMKLMFVGAGHRRNLKVYDFTQAFKTTAIFTNKNLEDCIHHLFKDTCDLWYSGKRPWRPNRKNSNGGFDDLPTSFEKQLKLDDVSKQERVRMAIDALHEYSAQDVSVTVSAETVRFERVGNSAEILPNPLHFWQHKRDCIPKKPKFVCITHGDLQARNLLVDESEHTWLIDFQRTGWGPGLRDAAELESAIKFDLLNSDNLSALLTFEKSALSCRDLNQRIKTHELPRMRATAKKPFERAALTIDAIRYESSRALEHPPFEEYLAGLFFYALKMLTFGDVSAETDQPGNTASRVHMLYSAAQICALLEAHHNATNGS